MTLYEKFGRWCAEEWKFGNDLDGVAIQEKLQSLGIIVPVRRRNEAMNCPFAEVFFTHWLSSP